jgi:hypothetical protein
MNFLDRLGIIDIDHVVVERAAKALFAIHFAEETAAWGRPGDPPCGCESIAHEPGPDPVLRGDPT